MFEADSFSKILAITCKTPSQGDYRHSLNHSASMSSIGQVKDLLGVNDLTQHIK